MTNPLSSQEIRQRFLAFFEKRGHAILPSAPLVPENDPSVLFNTAGMQPLVPYLLGEPHPKGKRLASAQKCVRTGDIDDVGDNTHATFFEMMGNWSLGDYFKEEAIKWSFEFLTSKEEGLGLDPQRLYVTLFEGDSNAPRDNKAAEIWKKYLPENRIYFLGVKDNWWSPGENGPCGPDTEMFYDLTVNGLGELSHDEFVEANDSQKVVEIWNDVFMEYEKKNGKVVGKLKDKNVDTGSGLERITAVVQNKNNIFDTDIFSDVIDFIKVNSPNFDLKPARVIADHIRCATFLLADGVLPSNKDQGYVLRRLIRRSMVRAKQIGLDNNKLVEIRDLFIKKYVNSYPELEINNKKVNQYTVFTEEMEKFLVTLDKGLREFERMVTITAGGLKSKMLSAEAVFKLVTSFGFPFELVKELAKEKGLEVDGVVFETMMAQHKETSKIGAEQKFKGGLADTSEQTIKYHTATHLLNQALTDALGSHVEQKGSNITPERLRFDFSHPEKLTDDQIKQVEDIVNQKISEALPVEVVTLPKEEALKSGARHVFLDKYSDEVTVYYIGSDLASAYSKEFCGGPHVKNTSELGHFKITKEEAVAQGIRRIKAVLE